MNNDQRNSRKRILAPAPASGLEIGKLPPQAVDLEEAVLGAILMDSEAYHEVADMLFPEAFYKEQYGRICQAILNLKNRGEAVDILTVTQELKNTGELEFVGGSYAIAKLTERLGSSANIQFHMRIVQQMYTLREIIRSCTERIKDSYEHGADSFEVLDNYERDLNQLTSQLFITKMVEGSTLFKQLLEDNAILQSKEGTYIGIDTGFHDLNILTGGWQKTDMIVLAARPGMGKTALMLRYVAAAVKSGKPTAVFSLEMSAGQLYKRLASQETQIPLDMITRTGMDAATVVTLKRDFEPILKAPLYIDDQGAITLADLRRKARKMKREKGIELIVIDYLQLMGGEDRKGNREQEVSNISRGIKALAKELNIPIIALSQLSREAEKRPGVDNVPKLADLRDSGAIEQDADMVQFIYRPEYYKIEHDANGVSTKGRAQVIIAKNRHGALDKVNLKWIGTCVLFLDENQAVKVPLPIPTVLPPNNDFTEQKDSPF